MSIGAESSFWIGAGFAAGFVDGAAALFQDGDALAVLVDEVYVVAQPGEGGGGVEADVAGTEDGDFHWGSVAAGGRCREWSVRVACIGWLLVPGG